MERNSFLSKSLFAILVWLAIFVSVVPVHGPSTTGVNAIFTSVRSGINSLSESVDSLLSIKEITNKVTVMLPIKSTTDAKPVQKTDLQCMAENIYYEAANQSYAGKLAVGHVVLNRLKQPGYPNTICGVIYDGSQNVKTTACQFSWTCAPHNPIATGSDYWKQSLAVAKELLTYREAAVDITEGATSYHADYVKPDWSRSLRLVTKIDQHLFYKKLY